MKTKVSIIVPVYNVEDYVLRCLDSLGRQKYDDIEIIIIDDGSTDKSGKICDEFAKVEKRAKVFHKKNGGLSDARNYGIKKASGELIAFVDSDDYVENNYISKMIETLKSNESDIVVCGYNSECPEDETVSGFDATYYCLARQDNIDIVAWNKLYKKKLFMENGIEFPKGEKHEDLLTTYKVMSKANKVSYISDALYHYEERKGSITDLEMVEEKLKMRARAAKEATEYFKDDKELYNVAKVSMMLAKYAYIDAALSGKIGNEYYDENMKWLRHNVREYDSNKYLTSKLKLYNKMSLMMGGIPYKLFRKILHE